MKKTLNFWRSAYRCRLRFASKRGYNNYMCAHKQIGKISQVKGERHD